ncbi:MAG: hypothetical protein ACFFE4_18140 [Candidatus Thorarchaeota archaeon]
MKLWIIYKEGIGFSRIIAEILQDRLEDYIDVFIGNAKKVDPSYLVEEKLEYLITGDVISDNNPSMEIQNWLLKFFKLVKECNFHVKAISGFYVVLTNNSNEPAWVSLLQENIKTEIIYPPVLRIRLDIEKMALEEGSLELIKAYVNNFVNPIGDRNKFIE